MQKNYHKNSWFGTLYFSLLREIFHIYYVCRFEQQERTSIDFRCDVCGQRAFLALKKEILEFRLDVFLVQTKFEIEFKEALKVI